MRSFSGEAAKLVRELSKVPRVHLERDFRRVFAQGRRFGSRYLTAVVCGPGEPGTIRIGFVVGKRVGKAVRRNKVKRRLRAAASELLRQAPGEADVVVIARTGAAEAGYRQLHEQLAELLRKAGLVSPDCSSGQPCAREC